jgi:transmembrane sensor
MTEAREPLSQLERLKRHLEADFSEHDVERLVRGGLERGQRRRIRRTLATGLVVGAMSTTLIVLLLPWLGAGVFGTSSAPVAPLTGSSRPAVEKPHAPEVVSLSDESRVVPLVRDTQLAVEEDAPERVRLRLDRGRARFEVTRRPQRSFSVRTGNVTVSVVGTTFAIEVVADRVGVSVEQGAVEVDWGVGRKRLLANESGWFPPLVMSGQSQGAEPEDEENREQASELSVKPAFSAPSAGSSRAPALTAQQLFAEVDAARSRGQPERAVEILREILREHPTDPRAPLAAFTLGRMLLNELGQPREAAAAFHEVRKKAASGQFAEDALAREVEAWSRASEPGRARALASMYLERYPSGRHARRVKALSGLQ